MTNNGVRTGIFGGSFDPVHVGHLSIAKSFLNSRLIDQLLILPAPEPPHKSNKSQVSFDHRLNMLQLAFSGWENVKVSDLEQKLPRPSYTLQTILHLKENRPGDVFFLCIGQDNLVSFHKWWEYEKILEEVPLLVAERPGTENQDVDSAILERTIMVDHAEIDLSSTELRNSSNFRKIEDKVPGSVASYIRDHDLYISN